MRDEEGAVCSYAGSATARPSSARVLKKNLLPAASGEQEEKCVERG